VVPFGLSIMWQHTDLALIGSLSGDADLESG